MSYLPWMLAMMAVRYFVMGQDLREYDLFRSFTLIQTDGPMILPVGWTLTFELMFYAVFGLCMLLPRRLALAAISLWGLASLLLGSRTGTIYFSPFVAEFAAGVILAGLWMRAKNIYGGIPTVALIAILAFSVGVLISPIGDVLARVLTFGTFSLCLVWIAMLLEEHGLAASSIWVFLGNTSYALYLSHFVILTLGRQYWRWVLADPDMAFCSMMIASLLASCVWYLWVDKPATKRIGSLAHSRVQANA